MKNIKEYYFFKLYNKYLNIFSIIKRFIKFSYKNILIYKQAKRTHPAITAPPPKGVI